MSKTYHIDSENPNPEVINLAVTVLRDGGIVVFPTETVYGIGALVSARMGSEEIYEVKDRPLDQPLQWLVESEDALDIYGSDVPEYAHRLAKAYWPGPLTLVVKASDRVGKDFRAPDGSIGLRAPNHEVVIELLHAAGEPMISSSANTHGKPAPANAVELEDRIIHAADVVLDGGETIHQEPSTVVDCTHPEPTILREGAIAVDEIMRVAAGEGADARE